MKKILFSVALAMTCNNAFAIYSSDIRNMTCEQAQAYVNRNHPNGNKNLGKFHRLLTNKRTGAIISVAVYIMIPDKNDEVKFDCDGDDVTAVYELTNGAANQKCYLGKKCIADMAGE